MTVSFRRAAQARGRGLPRRLLCGSSLRPAAAIACVDIWERRKASALHRSGELVPHAVHLCPNPPRLFLTSARLPSPYTQHIRYRAQSITPGSSPPSPHRRCHGRISTPQKERLTERHPPRRAGYSTGPSYRARCLRWAHTCRAAPAPLPSRPVAAKLWCLRTGPPCTRPPRTTVPRGTILPLPSTHPDSRAPAPS